MPSWMPISSMLTWSLSLIFFVTLTSLEETALRNSIMSSRRKEETSFLDFS